MNRNDDWEHMKGQIKLRWAKLSDYDLRVIDGSRERLIGTLKTVYGLSQREAEQQARKLERSYH